MKKGEEYAVVAFVEDEVEARAVKFTVAKILSFQYNKLPDSVEWREVEVVRTETGKHVLRRSFRTHAPTSEKHDEDEYIVFADIADVVQELDPCDNLEWVILGDLPQGYETHCMEV